MCVAGRYRMSRARVLVSFTARLVTQPEGTLYAARACGRQRGDGLWEGWIEFVPDDGTAVRRTARETTQPNLTDLEYWATGLTPVYLEGALERTLAQRRRPRPTPPGPAYEEPASFGTAADRAAADEDGTPTAILDPFSVRAKGDDLLRAQLHALSPRQLRGIIRAYELATELDVLVETMTRPELIALIMAGTQPRPAL
jgi:hypothetical protein